MIQSFSSLLSFMTPARRVGIVSVFAVLAVMAANAAATGGTGEGALTMRVLALSGLATLTSAAVIAAATAALNQRWRDELTEGQERERQALAAAERAREHERGVEAESRARSGFLAVMSHEIRTPMNGVLGLAGVLLDTPLNEQQRKMVVAIRDSGDALMRILNDILDFSKLDAGKMALEYAAFSPAALTRSPVNLLGPRAGAKGLRMEAVCDPDLPAAVSGDSGRIRQVLLNLVSNAVKFSEQGSVTVHASCPEINGDTATLVWTISDTGMGIPPDRLDGLFREFMQVDSSINRRFGGSGLGLAISKRIIEQMGGTIGVTSRLGHGSTFRVTLRLPVAEPVLDEEAAPLNAAAAFAARLRVLGRPMRLLFAEDNPTNQFVAMQSLRGFDVQSDMVADGLEAVHAASSFVYDVICMDMRMPDMDGLAATRAIRARGGHLATVPIIALTANAFPEDVRACQEAGMTGFLAKPVRRDAFLAALLGALDQTAPDEPEAAPPPEDKVIQTALDRDAFGQLTEEIGPEGVIELAAMFDAETEARLAALAAGTIPPERMRLEIHSLKGAASAACAVELSWRAAALEVGLTRGGGVTEADIAGLTEAFGAWRSAARLALAETEMALEEAS